MEKEVLREPMFVEEIVNVIRSGLSEKELIERLRDYHENDNISTIYVVDENMKKRLPWLVVLLFLGMGVSTVVGAFEGVV